MNRMALDREGLQAEVRYDIDKMLTGGTEEDWPAAERIVDTVLRGLGLDDLDAAVERAGVALSSFRLTATPDAIEEPWSRRMAAVVLEAALTATEAGQP